MEPTIDFMRNGAPLTWTTYIVGPNTPHTILWTGLAGDIIFWIAIIYLVLYFPVIRQKKYSPTYRKAFGLITNCTLNKK
jgi:hypothetical protein